MIIVSLFLLIPFPARASVVISEVMYDLDGADSGREWVEVYNGSTEDVDLSTWKFYEAETNHKIKEFQGGIILPVGRHAIIADNPDKFLIDWPDFSGAIFDSSFSLKNSGENLAIRDSELVDIDSVFYNPELGAGGDGNSLQLASEGGWIVAEPTPDAQNSVGGQEEEINKESLTNETDSPSEVSWPVESQIYANGGEDKTGIAGADVVFTGRALGLKKEPLNSAHYSWNFGDGGIAEGQKVRHSYMYPADYIVWLNVSSGGYSAGDKVLVKIISNELSITKADNQFIELYNGSKVDINISGWFLRNSNLPKTNNFKFPENTFIKAGSRLPISSEVSGLKIKNGEVVKILYPNGSLANVYKKSMGKINSDQKEIQNKKKTIVEAFHKNEIPDSSAQFNKVDSRIAVATSTSTQEANVISIVNDSETWPLKWWLILVLLVGVAGGSALIFARREQLD